MADAPWTVSRLPYRDFRCSPRCNGRPSSVTSYAALFTVAFRGIGNHLDFQTMRLTTPAHRILEFATSQRATPMQRAVGTGRLRQSRLPAEWVEQTIDVKLKQVPCAGLLRVKMLSWQ